MSLVVVGLIHVGVIAAIVSGLASAQLMKKVEDITTEVIKDKPPEQPKVPPPPPPELVKPPPPYVPPPDINVTVETPTTNAIHAQSEIQHQEVKPAVSSPAAVGRPHVCPQAKWYPPLALRLSHEGTTTLAFTVNTDGTISNISIAQSSGHDELDQAAVACAGSWSNYKPAMQNGQPVSVPWKASVKWNLQGG